MFSRLCHHVQQTIQHVQQAMLHMFSRLCYHVQQTMLHICSTGYATMLGYNKGNPAHRGERDQNLIVETETLDKLVATLRLLLILVIYHRKTRY